MERHSRSKDFFTRVTIAGQIIAWTLAALLLAANIAGYRYDLYQAAWWFDRVLHGSTLFAMGFWLAIVVFARGMADVAPIARRTFPTVVGEHTAA